MLFIYDDIFSAIKTKLLIKHDKTNVVFLIANFITLKDKKVFSSLM